MTTVIDTIVRAVDVNLRGLKLQPELQPLLRQAFMLKDEGNSPDEIRTVITEVDRICGNTKSFVDRSSNHLRQDFG